MSGLFMRIGATFRGIGPFVGQASTATPPPPPPPPSTSVGAFLFNLAAQSGLLVLLEDI